MGSINSYATKLGNIFDLTVATELGCSEEQMLNNQIGLNEASLALEVSSGIELGSEANITRPLVPMAFRLQQTVCKAGSFLLQTWVYVAIWLLIFLPTSGIANYVQILRHHSGIMNQFPDVSIHGILQWNPPFYLIENKKTCIFYLWSQNHHRLLTHNIINIEPINSDTQFL